MVKINKINNFQFFFYSLRTMEYALHNYSHNSLYEILYLINLKKGVKY